MINDDSLLLLLEKTFSSSVGSFDITKLFGDASDRVYYRITWQYNHLTRSCILMELADSGAGKSSEEANSKTSSAIHELPFINIQRHLFACKLPVPEIFSYDEEHAWMILEDLGDTTFAEKVEQNLNNIEGLNGYYQKALDLLISIHHRATPILSHHTIAHTRNFDQGLFEWEFDHFIEYGIEKRQGIPLPPSKKKKLQNYFSKISSQLAALPQVFTHRDYHSRNLMLQPTSSGEKIRLIDFQDALMGPPQYDLASLLRDSYIDLPDHLVEHLLSYYIKHWENHSGEPVDHALFKESFDLISIQRNLKAAARFIYIDQVKHKNHLLPYVSPTLLKAGKTLRELERLEPLYNLLSEDVPEFRSEKVS